MSLLHQLIEQHIPLAWVILLLAFLVLSKSAEVFVSNAVSVAYKLKIPKLIVGIVLVSLATTTPELSVSLLSALSGHAEMALGNAIGSVICDDGLALGLGALFITTPILIDPTTLKTSGLFLVASAFLCFCFVLDDATLTRIEGIALIAVFIAYVLTLLFQHRNDSATQGTKEDEHIETNQSTSLKKSLFYFSMALLCIIFASDLIISSASTVARSFGIPDAIIALTLVAFGTSIPEVATCVVAIRQGHGALAVGNILGADIMNICWVAGASATANDLKLQREELFFMFPSLFIVVLSMLLLLRLGYSMTRKKGIILLVLYVAYILAFFYFFPASQKREGGSHETSSFQSMESNRSHEVKCQEAADGESSKTIPIVG